MGENLRENTPPPDSDPELTWIVSNSPSPSAITLDASKELPLRCSHAALDASTEWTNEKHKQYINSLETSFVNKLYSSMRLREWNKQKNFRGTHSSQDGGLQKINLQRNETLMDSTADSHVTMKSPWISHVPSAGKGCNESSPNLREHVLSCNMGIHLREKLTSKNIYASSRSSGQNITCHQNSFGSTREVAGQNFVDEDDGGKLRNESVPKRHKRAAADGSSNDQLVPSGKFGTKEVSMVHNVPSEREEGTTNCC